MMHKFYLSVRQHASLLLQIAFGLLFVVLGIYFINQEKAGLNQVAGLVKKGGSLNMNHLQPRLIELTYRLDY